MPNHTYLTCLNSAQFFWLNLSMLTRVTSFVRYIEKAWTGDWCAIEVQLRCIVVAIYAQTHIHTILTSRCSLFFCSININSICKETQLILLLEATRKSCISSGLCSTMHLFQLHNASNYFYWQRICFKTFQRAKKKSCRFEMY